MIIKNTYERRSASNRCQISYRQASRLCKEYPYFAYWCDKNGTTQLFDMQIGKVNERRREDKPRKGYAIAMRRLRMGYVRASRSVRRNGSGAVSRKPYVARGGFPTHFVKPSAIEFARIAEARNGRTMFNALMHRAIGYKQKKTRRLR